MSITVYIKQLSNGRSEKHHRFFLQKEQKYPVFTFMISYKCACLIKISVGIFLMSSEILVQAKIFQVLGKVTFVNESSDLIDVFLTGNCESCCILDDCLFYYSHIWNKSGISFC